MSIFGTVDDVDLRCWQARNLKVLTELVRIGQERRLHPLFWTLPDAGTITGKTGLLRDDLPRIQFEAWHDALLADKRITTRGLGFRGDQPYRSERTSDGGATRLIAAFDFTLINPAFEAPAQICLLADWFEEAALRTGEHELV